MLLRLRSLRRRLLLPLAARQGAVTIPKCCCRRLAVRGARAWETWLQREPSAALAGEWGLPGRRRPYERIYGMLPLPLWKDGPPGRPSKAADLESNARCWKKQNVPSSNGGELGIDCQSS